MKKSILNLGKPLNKTEQKVILGGLDKFKCLVNYGDPRCCTAEECGNTGGIWCPSCGGYGTSNNCACF
ncbi:hypothetical protein [Tenacibaculum larymnensis]|uniref:Uncharacterized protein n=1 Tax=Tenacibaculum larymnensis TaxID=2878201 RepID=A0A9X4EPY9_9FLAO|nr:hypothetical protein [Tenacibaculum larymnensis]MDE1207243.1 hypothetical protein [Tenacibaculum larymnensis]